MAMKAQPQRGLTFDDVWAALMESKAEHDRMIAEMKEQFKETDKKFKETDKKFKETAELVGKLTNRFGDIVEHLIAPNLADKFNALGYSFTRAGPNIKYLGADKQPLTEVDIMLENGDVALAVEVKALLTVTHVQEHMERMEILRAYADDHGDKRTFLGAVAAPILHDNVKTFAIKSGFYVVEQSGDTVKVDMPADFKPKQW